jgi:hypothetical protein
MLGREANPVQKMAQMLGIKKTAEALSAIRASCVPSAASIDTRFKTKHGRCGKGDRTYQCWNSMKQRCLYQKHKSFASYGGAGVTICDKWLEFGGFIDDMGECPSGMSLDRIDGNKGYFKENCRWATPKQQARNRKSSRTLTAFGVTRLLVEWSELYGIRTDTLSWRLKKGMSVEDALIRPVASTMNARNS